MRLLNIDRNTEGTFFRCLHDEKPANQQAIELRRRWYEQHKDKGLRAKVLLREDNAVVGLCQYLPIEHSHFIGENLFAILCIWVHGYEHLVGNQQHKGYGRFVLSSIEEDARRSGAKGVAAWGMDFPHWNPVSFYEHMGYKRVEKNWPVVLVWKAFTEDAKPPALLHPKQDLSTQSDRTNVTVFLNGWCGVPCYWCVQARKAVEGLPDVAYEEIDTANRDTMLSWGIDDGVYVNGAPFHAKPFWTSEELRQHILKLSSPQP